MDAAGGFSTGDAQPIGQRVGELPPSSVGVACWRTWLIRACPGTGSRRVSCSSYPSSRKRSGVVNASNESPSSRDTVVCSASKTSAISPRILESMCSQSKGQPKLRTLLHMVAAAAL